MNLTQLEPQLLNMYDIAEKGATAGVGHLTGEDEQYNGRQITIAGKKGVVVYTGNTPADLKLKAGDGFFSKASYQVQFEKEGYETKIVPVEFKLDGWYIGNLLFGGIIGFLIDDPATGAMYKLETEFLNETLTSSTAHIQTEGLNVYSLTDIPKEWEKHLVALDN
ncbi:hypothetical protein [Croceiramulus getboli]|nr:hypothetical protein P8624_09190 [Flavobacteriaceae bacterium YJPT1-3]